MQFVSRLFVCFAMRPCLYRDFYTSVEMTVNKDEFFRPSDDNMDEIPTTTLRSAQDDNMDEILRLRYTPLRMTICMVKMTFHMLRKEAVLI